MIKKYNDFLNESNYTDEYKNIINIINKLVDNGNIILKDKTPEQITDIIINKNKKYPQIGFESFFINASNDKMFISEGDKERMAEYIDKVKELGIECFKLEELLPYYEQWRKLGLEEYNGYDESDNEISEEEYYKQYDDKFEKLKPVAEEFEKELKNISKKVAEKL